MAKSKVKKTVPKKPKAPKIVERSCTLTLRLGHAPTLEIEELEKLFGIKQGSKAIERVIMSYRARRCHHPEIYFSTNYYLFWLHPYPFPGEL